MEPGGQLGQEAGGHGIGAKQAAAGAEGAARGMLETQ